MVSSLEEDIQIEGGLALFSTSVYLLNSIMIESDKRQTYAEVRKLTDKGLKVKKSLRCALGKVVAYLLVTDCCCDVGSKC